MSAAFPRTAAGARFVTCDANLAVTLPPGLTDEQAVAAATANATAWYGLNDLAGIKAGDKVLIHSATGGVGQAAIAIARAAGAQIFATAGNPQKRALLHDMGIEHVYDSRSIEFAELIRRDTDGYGVDIVLNSLTGAAQRAGLELLAFGGRFVEIGKARRLRQHPAGAVPVPPRPDVLLRRPRADVRHRSPTGSTSCSPRCTSSSRTVSWPHRRAPTTRWPMRPPRSGQ